ncbi:hypothetical protein KP509_37G027900 [Ceratopteris richardii]|nr:hypothetical protein KP509_37G027900 [Ceratopteris richardii]
MSGGVSHVYVHGLNVGHDSAGIRIKSAQGRGGYVKDIYVSDVFLRNVKTAIVFTDLYGEHPDSLYNPNALPHMHKIYIQNVQGNNITMTGNFQGLSGYPFHDIFLRNITLNVTSTKIVWNCSYVTGYSESVSPSPCEELAQNKSQSSSPL